MKRIVVAIFLLSSCSLCMAALPFQVVHNDPLDYVITGVVEKIGVNTIDIRDEDDKVLKQYVYFGTDVQIGDRVRAQYDPMSLRIELLKKMTKLEYKADGQNLGYVVKAGTDH